MMGLNEGKCKSLSVIKRQRFMSMANLMQNCNRKYLLKTVFNAFLFQLNLKFI